MQNLGLGKVSTSVLEMTWRAAPLDGHVTGVAAMAPPNDLKKSHTLWLFNIAMENDPFIYIYIIIWYTWYTFLKWWFSMAMLNNQRVRKMMNSCWNGVPGRLSSDKSNMLIVVAVMLDDAWCDSFLNSSCTRKTRNRTKLNLPANKIKETCRMNVVF